jgi:NAD(P)-dependent dehydrogenase (short-subunit alcohol dehydrogenase family)
MKIEIEHEGSCLGATSGTGRLIVRDALAKDHSVVVLVRSKVRALDLSPGVWRLTYAFENGDAILIDYEDYH